jgi:hypothetical protein
VQKTVVIYVKSLLLACVDAFTAPSHSLDAFSTYCCAEYEQRAVVCIQDCVFLLPTWLWHQPASGVSIFRVSEWLWCQPASGVGQLPVSASFWCQPFSGVRISLVSGFLWYQHFPDVRIPWW